MCLLRSRSLSHRAYKTLKNWSGRWDSNPRPRPWQGRALPLSYARIRPIHITLGEGGCKGLRAARLLPIVRPMPPMPLTRDQLFARLDALGIAHRTYNHPPVFTVAEAVALRGRLQGGHCKSLFLKDKKAGLWLVVALEERAIDLKRLAAALGAPRFSFGNPELLYEVLGVRPGSVTPFALANDATLQVQMVLDKGMLDRDPLNYHPLENDRTTAIAPGDLLRFITACGHTPRVVDLATVAPDATQIGAR
jgi:Ala-tRNA(Pro) deacylase